MVTASSSAYDVEAKKRSKKTQKERKLLSVCGNFILSCHRESFGELFASFYYKLLILELRCCKINFRNVVNFSCQTQKFFNLIHQLVTNVLYCLSVCKKTTLSLEEDIAMALRVDEELCSGCELCVQICPDVFEMDSTGISKVKEGADENLECVDEAIDSCPTAAIIRE